MFHVDPMLPVNAGWPVDGHVHFHTLAGVGQTLDAAVANFRAAGGRSEGLVGAVLLTQTFRERVFELLSGSATIAGWTFASAQDEPESLIARQGMASLAVTCGRQVRAEDGLEVLALGTRETFPDGMAFGETVDAVHRSGALTVIPWAFGKWLGARGKRVEKTLESFGAQTVFVGDNGGRLGLLGQPPLIRSSEKRGYRILPGSDPFPFGGDHRRVGRFGFVADLCPSEAAPWRELRTWLLSLRTSPRPYGRALGPAAFLFNQFGIQALNRISHRSPA